MKPSFLAWITLCLLLLVVGERIGRALEANRQAVATEPKALTQDTAAARAASSASRLAGRLEPHRTRPTQPEVSTVERLARLAARRELARTASGTYLDSLLLTTDSVIRRWPDRDGVPIRVAIIEGGPDDYRPEMADEVRRALNIWQSLDLNLSFELTADSADADIVVRWIDHFDFDRAGQTDLTWDQSGHVRHASIVLAIRSVDGTPLSPPALRAVALHETGHALGLPHSADSSDVMFPATRTDRLSERDRRSALVLYHIPAGPLRDAAPPQ
ncbi:MAG TPA: matrixin family metalloprotease [Gemmatimonadales bacterium]|nr:matrixin family metalloprotease [Gemmatimonadales bacterium]